MAKHPAPPPDNPPQSGSAYRRWSQRKLQQRRAAAQRETGAEAAVPGPAAGKEPAAGEVDLPPLDALDEHSTLSAFFAEGVSEELRRSALRKVFHLQKYNFCDGLDDYAEDYTHFQPLGDVMTADLRLRLEREARKCASVDESQIAGPADSAADRAAPGAGGPQEIPVARSDDAEPPAKS
jgi:hypothetical protein